MKYGSVCSGVEAASLAWEPLGWEAAWFAEIEPFPSAVLAHHWPHVPNHGDMLTLPEKVANEDIPAPDVLVGGTPCQAFSVAGRRGSLEDERGALTLAFVELADAIDTVRSARGEPPAIIVWENVPGVLSTKDNAFGCFLAGLAGETEPLESPGKRWANAGCVFGPQRTVAWRTLDAQYFGLAQRRRRVFVVASARDGFHPGAVLFESEGVRRDSPPSRGQGEEAASTVTSCIGENGGIPAGKDATPRNLIPTAFGQNRQSGPVETSHALRAKGGTGHGDFESETFLVQAVSGEIAHTLKADGFDGSEGGTGRGVPTIAFSAKDHGGDAMEDLAPTLRAGGHNTSHANAGVMPAVCFAENSRGEVRLEGGDGRRTGALSTGGGKPGQGQPVIASDLAARRLTPVECERLQGFPDDHTNIPAKAKRDDGGRCAKQTVRATVISPEGRYFIATNHCEAPQAECPRAAAGMGTGEGYELCRSVCGQERHAEENALALAGKKAQGGVLYIEGHSYACERCQLAAEAAGIADIRFASPPGNAADGPRYKAIGNSMAVAVMGWIGQRVDARFNAPTGSITEPSGLEVDHGE